jgi:3-deoxy-D-manno-octulosonic-acid transferase
MADRARALPLLPYRLLAPAIAATLPLGRFCSAKLRDGLDGRRGLSERVVAAAPRLRGAVWFHAASVGEYEQARPVIAALRALSDAPPVVMTHFSPSGWHYAARRPCADRHEWLPFDTPRAMAGLLEAWRPRALVFIKFDCWPNLVLEAARRGVPVLLLAGTLQPRSWRLRSPLRPFFRALFDRFTALGVCTDDDRRRFTEQLGVRATVTVTGDTRAEQVILRFEAAAGGDAVARLSTRPGRRLVLGSTWPADEAIWLPVLPDLVTRFPDLTVVLAPHEPSASRLADLERRLATCGVETTRLSSLPPTADAGRATTARCVLVDSVGVLAEIYRAGALAYVGGSFTTGVHNTLEPAVASLPVLFGPVMHNAVEAETLVAQGAGRIVRRPAEAAAAAAELLADPARLAAAGAAARAIVLAQRGATGRSLALLRSCM